MLLIRSMSPSKSNTSKSAEEPQAPHKRKPGSAVDDQEPVPVDPVSQSPEDPIVFTSNNDVARGNTERANAEPEPAALHSAQVPGVPDVAAERRIEQHEAEDDDKTHKA